MFSSLMRLSTGSPRAEAQRALSPPPGPSSYPRRRHATADFTEADDDDEDDDFLGEGLGAREGTDASNEEEEDEDGLHRRPGVLPLFSASHLDSLPIYSITHAIRILVQTRTETTLTWEQLRSPQVSQFLVKPMQQQIRTQHFSRATLYALMANCLQFAKEGQLYPGLAGTSSTRSKVCELLAIKLLKEYTTRELIDSLSYDFYPLQGSPSVAMTMSPRDGSKPVARTSTLEVAIRASAKHFLAHPLVVQHLEAIWNGAISFYSSADSLHRQESSPVRSPHIELPQRSSDPRTPLLGIRFVKEEHPRQAAAVHRRTVTLYDPRKNASPFKLSRLRVPRYRQFFSTCSLGILIALFLAVLIKRSSRITTLELVFWFWSAGFMLDELVGFTEQGFSLYIMSFWNIFDLGILLLLIIYYCMRIWGVFLPDPHRWNDNAYNVLAANAILLLPRVFSVLDHYQYFSQLLIAFRLMAVDLAAVFILILISCSGFFVFFTLSRSTIDAGEIAYRIFQILMGFSPAAWELWPQYDALGKTLIALFMIISHFVVITILITVLTNSFTTIASNASEEHQFLFAINTISMVKNDALFSYVPPGNIFAWILMPLRYCVPLRQFVWLNRTIIKATHFPLLFSIYFYERLWLAPSMYEPTDLVENPGRSFHRSISFADPGNRSLVFSPHARVREESVIGFQKDRALEEVFRQTPDLGTLRTQRRDQRRKNQNAVRDWMAQNDGLSGSLQHYSTIDSRPGNEWVRRLSISRDKYPKRFRQMSDGRSAASDPADLLSNHAFPLAPGFPQRNISRNPPEVKYNTDADGDDELVTNDEDEDDKNTNMLERQTSRNSRLANEDYFNTPLAGKSAQATAASSSLGTTQQQPVPSPRPGGPRRGHHSRTISTNTILYNPTEETRRSPVSSSSSDEPACPRSRPLTRGHTPGHASPATPAERRTPKRSSYLTSRPRPIVPPRDIGHITPGGGRSGLAVPSETPAMRAKRRLSSVNIGEAPSDLASAVGPEGVNDTFGAVPSSFVTQMAMATGMMNPLVIGNSGDSRVGGDSDRMSRLVLARMKTLEEGFADVVREMRALQRSSGVPSTAQNSGEEGRRGSSAYRGPGLDVAMIEIASNRGRPDRAASRRAKNAASRSKNGTRPSSRSAKEKEGEVGLAAETLIGSKEKGKEADDEQEFLHEEGAAER